MREIISPLDVFQLKIVYTHVGKDIEKLQRSYTCALKTSLVRLIFELKKNPPFSGQHTT